MPPPQEGGKTGSLRLPAQGSLSASARHVHHCLPHTILAVPYSRIHASNPGHPPVQYDCEEDRRPRWPQIPDWCIPPKKEWGYKVRSGFALPPGGCNAEGREEGIRSLPFSISQPAPLCSCRGPAPQLTAALPLPPFFFCAGRLLLPPRPRVRLHPRVRLGGAHRCIYCIISPSGCRCACAMQLPRRHCLVGRQCGCPALPGREGSMQLLRTLQPCPACSLSSAHCFLACELCCHPLPTPGRASGPSLTTATAMATTTTVRLDWTGSAEPHLKISADWPADCGPSVCLSAAGNDYNNGGNPDYNNGEPGWRAGGQRCCC